jgi:hypothetical protein
MVRKNKQPQGHLRQVTSLDRKQQQANEFATIATIPSPAPCKPNPPTNYLVYVAQSTFACWGLWQEKHHSRPQPAHVIAGTGPSCRVTAWHPGHDLTNGLVLRSARICRHRRGEGGGGCFLLYQNTTEPETDREKERLVSTNGERERVLPTNNTRRGIGGTRRGSP